MLGIPSAVNHARGFSIEPKKESHPAELNRTAQDSNRCPQNPNQNEPHYHIRNKTMPKVLKRLFLLVDIEVNASVSDLKISQWVAEAFMTPGRMDLQQVMGCASLSQLIQGLEEDTDLCTPKRVERWREYEPGKWSITVRLPHADGGESDHIIRLKPRP